MSKKKQFKIDSDYYKNFILFVLFIFGIVSLIIDFGFFWSETEILKHYEQRKIVGTAIGQFAIALQKIVASKWGKTGLLLLLLLSLLLFIGLLSTEISEYRRYKKKWRLYQEGVIKNIADIYDDYHPQNIFRRIKNLFRKKPNEFKYSRKKKRKQKKEMEEYYKKNRK
jgi:hypothetical protein